MDSRIPFPSLVERLARDLLLRHPDLGVGSVFDRAEAFYTQAFARIGWTRWDASRDTAPHWPEGLGLQDEVLVAPLRGHAARGPVNTINWDQDLFWIRASDLQ